MLGGLDRQIAADRGAERRAGRFGRRTEWLARNRGIEVAVRLLVDRAREHESAAAQYSHLRSSAHRDVAVKNAEEAPFPVCALTRVGIEVAMDARDAGAL